MCVYIYVYVCIYNHVKFEELTNLITESLWYVSTSIAISPQGRITEWLRLEGSSEGHLVQLPCSSRVTFSRLARTTTRWLLNISRDGDSTTTLAKLCQCSVTLTVKSVSWCSEGTSRVSVCACCLWSWHWAPLKRPWLPILCTLPSGFYVSRSDPPPEPSLLQAKQWEVLQSLHHLVALLQTLSTMSTSLLNQGAQDWKEHSRCGLTSAE